MVAPLTGSGLLNKVRPAVPMFTNCVVTLRAEPVPTLVTVAVMVKTWPALTKPAGKMLRLWMETLPCANTDTALLVLAAEVTPMF
jgi:hypothetical protein